MVDRLQKRSLRSAKEKEAPPWAHFEEKDEEKTLGAKLNGFAEGSHSII